MCYCPTPTLHLNLALTGDGAFLFSPQKTHSVWFISVLNYGDTENVLINHVLLVRPMSYPCHYTTLCPHKPHTHTIYIYNLHTHTRLFVLCEFFMLNFFISIFIYPLKDWTFYSQSLYKLQKSFDYYLSLPKKQVICRSCFLLHVQDCLRVFINVFAWQGFGKSMFSYFIFVL